jgi:hypothetical protein
MDGVNEQSPRIAGTLPGNRQNVVQSVVASRGHGKDAKTVWVVPILELFIEADLTLPTLDILLGMDSLRAVIKLDEEVELLAIQGMKFECAIRDEGLAADLERQRKFPPKLVHTDTRPVGHNQGMDNEVSKAAGVMMVGNGDLVEIPFRRRLSVLTVKKAVTQQC